MFRSFTAGALCALSATALIPVTAKGAGFQPGDVAVLRVLSTSTGAVELDEYSSTGLQTSPLNVVSIPSSGNNSLTVNNFFGSSLKLSGDDSYLTLAGLQVISSTIYGVVGRVNVSDGTVDLSTKIANIVGNSSSSPVPRSAVTSNGNDIWVAGNFGVGYTTLGSSTATRVNQATFRALSTQVTRGIRSA